MSTRQKHPPTSWSAYERGRASSFGSLESVPEGQQPNFHNETGDLPTNSPPAPHNHHEQDLHRKSSFTNAFASLRQRGGVNSIDNFAKSFQRAATFRQITPARTGSIIAFEVGQEEDDEAQTGPALPNKSLLRQQFEAAGAARVGEAITDEDNEQSDHIPTEETRLIHPIRQLHNKPSTIGSTRASSITVGHGPAFGTSYGSISAKITQTARRRASILIQEHYEASIRAREDPDDEFKEPEHHIEHEVLPDGEVIERVVGESTVPQTIFNSTNVLIGVGILALPLGIRYAGWIIGLTFLTFAAVTTSYTAMLLSKCLDTNTGSTTYGDIAYLAFGSVGRNIVEVLFILELLAANVALVILFADSMNSLVPALNVLSWKMVIAFGLIPLNFVSFRLLSVTSVIGIFAMMGIVLIVFTDGLIKPHSPGSLRDIAKTWAFPLTWKSIPLSFGLFMAPWGGHSVFPAVYKDMRHPRKYGKALRYTYTFTYGLDLSMAVLGYLMFGDFVREEITANILKEKSYPAALSVIIVILICVIPIAKAPLNNRPMMDTINKKFQIDLRQMEPEARHQSEKNWKHRLARSSTAVLLNIIELGISIGFPDFDSIMALMGSALCFTICIILPVVFYLRIFSLEGKGISLAERVFDWFLIVVCSILAVFGVVFAIIPKDALGVK